MRMAVDQATLGHLFWIICVPGILLNTVVYCRTFWKTLWTLSGVIGLTGLLLMVAILSFMFIAAIPAQARLTPAELVWEHLSPEAFRYLAVNVLGCTSLGLLTAIFLPSVTNIVIAQITNRLLAELQETPQLPT